MSDEFKFGSLITEAVEQALEESPETEPEFDPVPDPDPAQLRRDGDGGGDPADGEPAAQDDEAPQVDVDEDESPEAAEESEAEAGEKDAAEPETPDNPKDPWEKRYQDLQSFNEKRFNELRAEMKAHQDLLKNLFSGDDEAESEQEPIDPAALDQYIEQSEVNAVHAFQQLIAEGRFDAIPKALVSIRKHHGDEHYELASAAATEARQQYLQHQFLAQQEAMQAPQRIQQALVQSIQDLSTHYGEAFDSNVSRIHGAIQADPSLIGSGTPAEIALAMKELHLGFVDSDLRAKEMSLREQPRQLDPSEHVPAGQPKGSTPDPSPDQKELGDLGEAFRGLGSIIQ